MKSRAARNLTAITVFVLAGGFFGQAIAAVITYSNRAAFEATLSTIVRDDYENPGYVFQQTDAAMSAVLGETDYRTTGFPNNDLVFGGGGAHYYCAGCNGSYLMDFTSTSVSGVGGVFGVGFDFYNEGSPLYDAFVTFGDNTTMDIALPAAGFSPNGFFGITSDLMIKTVHLGLPGGGTTFDGSFAQDNLTIGNSVPEPTTLALLTLGLAGLGFSRRKQ